MIGVFGQNALVGNELGVTMGHKPVAHNYPYGDWRPAFKLCLRATQMGASLDREKRSRLVSAALPLCE